MRGPLAALLVLGCSGAPEPAPCPLGHHRDPARAAELEARLADTREGAPLAALLAGTAGICFAADAIDVITTERVLLLSDGMETGEAAARLGHLLVHVRDGLPMREAIPRGADCEALLDEALDREAQAHAAEMRLQRALGAVPRRHAFEITDAVLALPEAEQAGAVRAYLEAHPTGAPGIDGLAAGYLERCLRER